ncbi:MAG: hypothetical protein DWP92_02105 [Armatimonadetes bacterium]|nr:MAG: hypothetical protein DWP92_02105 [Armatimonadota bacterium]MCZ7532357.1 hypothetical protein [Acidimicrobiia bacterium]
MILVLIVVAVLVFAGLAVIGYRMGPAPGRQVITERDSRLQEERADQAAFRARANPNLRSDRSEAVESLAAAAVLQARTSVGVRPSLNETEALADALVHLDHLEREGAETSIGPLIPDVSLHLFSAGVLNSIDLGDPELSGLTCADVATNPGIIVRIVGVDDLSRWPRT